MCSQSVRQSELFAGEDWTVIYRAFTEINFNAYDYSTIRSSMVEYISFNYPEDFNDWIESSEFVAIIDLLAYLGQSLAFRMDINARDNFIDTAERRTSLLRLARLLSYQTSRNIPARGVAKIVSIQTTEPIKDSLGQNLQNSEIDWNDANNPDWYEQWTLIMNSSFISENRFGQPKKSATINTIPTQLYEMRNLSNNAGVYSFSTDISGNTLAFEVVNPDFDEGTTFFERTPRPNAATHLIYRNDGNGNSSSDTGFFVYFKQGLLSFRDFGITTPTENRVIEITDQNINQFDVWVQSVDDDGEPLTFWTKVPAVVGNNIIYNSLASSQRDIFSVVTNDDDGISLRFADGVFGNVPTGNIRCYYRTSSNTSYTILPENMQGTGISIPYYNADGEQYTLTITFDLQSAVSNSIESELDSQIRLRAPQVYYTQGRMVNGEDYNVFPLQSSEILKLRAINRVYSGHSRFIDIKDPTSNHQDVNVVADDGAVYRQINNGYQEIPLSSSMSSSELLTTIIFTELKEIELTHFFYKEYRDNIPDPMTVGLKIIWRKSTNASFSSTGSFQTSTSIITIEESKASLGIGSGEGSDTSVGVVVPAELPVDFITPGTLIEFATAGWVKVESVSDGGAGDFSTGKGKVTLNEEVETNDLVINIYPTFRTELISNESTPIKAELENENTFGLRFDHTRQEWIIITAANLSADVDSFSLVNTGDVSLTNLDQSWLIRFDFRTDHWVVITRGLRYVWESEKDVRFFVNQFYKIIANTTGRSTRDKLKVFKTEPKPDGSNEPLGKEISFRILDKFIYEDGYTEPRRVVVGFNDIDVDGVPDDPLSFEKLVIDGITEEYKKFIFHSSYVDEFGYKYFVLDTSIVSVPEFTDTAIESMNEDSAKIVNGAIVWNYTDNIFYQYTFDGVNTSITRGDSDNYKALEQELYSYEEGRQSMNFLWKHIATKDQRIDPAITNVIDIFTLTSTYDLEYRRWIADNTGTVVKPTVPTTESLRIAFQEFEEFKMASDQIIWRPVSYKSIFGAKSAEEYQAKFKVVKVAAADTSNGEVKAAVIQNINDYFDINNWEFGDTFYASELIAFIHQQMPGIIAGIELVPMNEEARFGNLQQIKSESDEIFVSAATVDDVEIIKAFTESALRVSN